VGEAGINPLLPFGRARLQDRRAEVSEQFRRPWKLKIHGHIREVYGWRTWIRTKINGVVRCSTVELSPTRWKAKFGRMDVSEARKLKTLKTENSRLKMLLSLP
jgi:hypothetical protein